MTISRRRKPAAWILACCALAALPAGAELFRATDQVGALPPTEAPWVIRARSVLVDLPLLHVVEPGGGLELPLFDDVRLFAFFDRVVPNRSGSRSWIGDVAGPAPEPVVLVGREGVLVGSVRHAGRLFQIVYLGGGVHEIQEIDESALPAEQEPLAVRPAPVETVPGGDPADAYDLMVVYTPLARMNAGGTVAMESWIDLGVAETNESYVVSGIDLEARLVHTEEVAYVESGNLQTDRSRLQNPADGFIDAVHARRDEHGADVTMLIVESPGCGISFIMTVVDPSFEAFAFNVVMRSCVSPNYTFAHEIGHNQSARHDWAVDPTNNSPFSFNHGYVHPGDQWRSVMAYSNACGGCPRQLFWSNPDRNHPVTGDPTGVPEGQPQAADNRKTLAMTAATVANFRPSAGLIFTDDFESGSTAAWSQTAN